MEIQVMSFVNDRNDMIMRNRRANEYSAQCWRNRAARIRAKFAQFESRHEDLLLMASGVGLVSSMIGIGIIIIIML